LLVAADVCAGAIAAAAAAALGKATHLTVQSAILALVAPLVAKILGLYDHDPARLRKSTLDELPALRQFAALLSFLALISSPVVFDGIIGPREAIALFVVVPAGLAAGRVVARRIGGSLISAERCLLVGPTDEAVRFGEKSSRITPRTPSSWLGLSSATPHHGPRRRSSIAPWPTRASSSDGLRSNV